MYTATEPDVLTRLTNLLNKLDPVMKQHVCELGEKNETLHERATTYRNVYSEQSIAGRSGGLEPYAKEKRKQEEERLSNKLMQEWHDKEFLLRAGKGQELETTPFVYPLQNLSPQLAWERLGAYPPLGESISYQAYAALYVHEVMCDVAPNLERLDIRIGGGMTPSVIIGSKDAYWALGRRNRLVINNPSTTWRSSSITPKAPMSTGELSLIESQVTDALNQLAIFQQAKTIKKRKLSKLFFDSRVDTIGNANRLLEDLQWSLTRLYAQISMEHDRLSLKSPLLHEDYKALIIEDCDTLAIALAKLGWTLSIKK